MFMDSSGPKLALIRVKHHHMTTWEVSKGKLELGEIPLHTAQREVQEEMGVPFTYGKHLSLGKVRFAFYTPQKEPRLKELYLYLLEVFNKPTSFTPAINEGVVDVAWFSPDEALEKVRHRTLKPIFRQMKHHLSALHLLGSS